MLKYTIIIVNAVMIFFRIFSIISFTISLLSLYRFCCFMVFRLINTFSYYIFGCFILFISAYHAHSIQMAGVGRLVSKNDQ